ncbi:chymotrypsinogen A-like [Anoplophora glabripennis]|uniref:chymotrypsinogen A-like n=1 Tax=Anoplophora glabripennis TaxID=217634 RepID=UPI000874515B|nr:chymotrypsinogen A-like [Anoplophora glabripennis]
MKYFASCIFLLLLCTANGQTFDDSSLWDNLPRDCGETRFDDIVTETVKDRIITGAEAKLGQFPWMARIGIKLGDGSKFFGCGGSLITKIFVVSAAHCGERANIVRLGQTYETNGTECDEKCNCAPPYQDIEIKNYIFEDFCRMSARNDLMLYELTKPAELNDYVQPICLPRISIPLSSLVGENVVTGGWGIQIATDPKSTPQNLMYIVVPVENIKKCIPLYEGFDRQTQFCLSNPNDKNVCSGDSGSAAVKFIKINGTTRAHLIGITSYGKENCNLSPVFTFVEYYLGSILRHVNNRHNKDLF